MSWRIVVRPGRYLKQRELRDGGTIVGGYADASGDHGFI